ncbi:ATP-binding protein [Pseudomonas aeruginosa]|uniref:ATP-binding protein n=1 Tax=Pseudomonas aeruginosa TaxID=287 RepID=UPI0029554C17|nr:ATP-binding protein [Pseudomonas aeruginosa]MDV7888953.1 ATP-binding protein [Pseudomonas aeruginosa]
MSSKEYLYRKLRPELLEPESKRPGNMEKPRSIEPRFTLERDVVLSASAKQQLDEAIGKIRNHQTIYVDWGFGEVDPCGSGTLLNFHGAPGTGKTLSAEAFAGTLGKRIITASIADLESKFMGDTAKNIALLFEATRQEDAVLFLDEADTLLGKRLSSVTQGIDNEVNAMRSTLLIELEKHTGIVIFATNFARNYDTAFVSRISQHIHFELPGYDERHAIWSRMLVPGIPLGEDRTQLLNALATLSDGLSGREIRTCMRLALPKPLMSNGGGVLVRAHIEDAILQLKATQKSLQGSHPDDQSAQLGAARKLLGISKGDVTNGAH